MRIVDGRTDGQTDDGHSAMEKAHRADELKRGPSPSQDLSFQIVIVI